MKCYLFLLFCFLALPLILCLGWVPHVPHPSPRAAPDLTFLICANSNIGNQKTPFSWGCCEDQMRYLRMLRYWTGKDFFFSIIIILGRVGIVNEAERWHNTTPRKQLWPVVLLLSPILCQLSLGPLVSYMVPKCLQEQPALSWAPSCTDKCCWVQWIRMGPSRGHTQGIFLAH